MEYNRTNEEKNSLYPQHGEFLDDDVIDAIIKAVEKLENVE